MGGIGRIVIWWYQLKKLRREERERREAENQRLRNEALDNQVLALARENFGRIKEAGAWHGTYMLTDEWKVTSAMALNVDTDSVRESVRRLLAARRFPWQS